jgi:hypothetical protein
MKKTILLFGILFFTAKTSAQQQKLDSSRFTISANYSYSDPFSYGISAELGNDDLALFNHYTSTLLNVSVSQMEYDNNIQKVKGTGFAVELGHRFYRNRGRKAGAYIQWLLIYSNTSFDKNTPLGHFDGVYSYWSLINNDIGYKIRIGNNLSLDPSIGYNWKWAVKGKGDIDNIYSDNFVFRCGIKLGYSF